MRPLLLASLLLAGCGGGVELAVDVRTDLVPGIEFDTVQVSVDGAAAPPVSAQAGDDFTRARRVAEVAGLAPGSRTVVVQLLRDGALVVSRRVAVRLESSLIVMVLLTRDCRGVVCPGSGDSPEQTECLGGRCVDPACSPLDPDSCGPAECEADAECARSVACVEAACVDGTCLELPGAGCAAGEVCHPELGCVPAGGFDAGPPVCTSDAECDDSIECTIDRCASGGCEHAPDDARCAEGVCDPAGAGADARTGCTAAPCTPETCVPGPCETATCVDGRCQRATTCADGETCCGGSICGVDCDEATACVGQPAGTVCRSRSGPCDAEETCDGSSPGCPPDALEPSGVECRPAGGACDVAETCTGTSADCPVDAFAPLGTSCAGGTCNGLGDCLEGCVPGAPCSTGNVCEIGAMDCSGTAPRCVPSGFAPATTVCRAAAGACDVEERCTGTSAACPPDARAASGTVCRAAMGPCDVAETCDGTSPACPADALRPAGYECRASAGPCDVAETCTGSSASCPSNAFRPSGYECRASAGPCDVAETCTGSSASCPSNAFRPAGTVCDATIAGPCDATDVCTGSSAACPARYQPSSVVCRAAAHQCDAAERCTGSSAACPPDAHAPDGTHCDLRCGFESCQNGVCSGGMTCGPGQRCGCDEFCVCSTCECL